MVADGFFGFRGLPAAIVPVGLPTEAAPPPSSRVPDWTLPWFAGISGLVVFGTYRDLFVAIAGAAGALTGLLFVALSVAPRRGPGSAPPVIQQVRAAAALLAFLNALAVSLFGLVPNTNVGYPAASLGVIGILFTAAGLRSVLSSRPTHRQTLRQLGLMALLLLIFTSELVSGIAVLADPHRSTPLQVIGYALVTSMIVGIARAWELVGDRDTGIVASIAVLSGHTPGRNSIPGHATSASPEPGDSPQHGSDGHQPGPGQ